jgi:hypothetical protein
MTCLGAARNGREKAGITIGEGDRAGLSKRRRPLSAAAGIQLSLTLDGVRTEWNNPPPPPL